MAPKRSTKKQGRGQGCMVLRSGPLEKRTIQTEDGSSHVFPLSSPKKRVKRSKRCKYIDDEASVDMSVDRDSNVLLGTPTRDPSIIEHDMVTPQSNTLVLHEEIGDVEQSHEEVDVEIGDVKHSRLFGESVPLGLMNDVLSQFNVIRTYPPPLVPLCRLIATEAVRVAQDEASWLIPLFDRACYVKTMGTFIVSLKGRHGEVKKVSQDIIENWDPIWQAKNALFESQLVGEWEDLRGKFFHVYDGNHRLKTWWRRIIEEFPEDEAHHVCVSCQFIEVDKKKEGELILALGTTNEIARATAKPNLGHEIFMFQKFGMANKLSIWERLTLEQRSWMELELKMEARQNKGEIPWYSTPCILISQLVWKGKWETFLTEQRKKLRSLGYEGGEFKKKMEMATKNEEEKLRDSGYKYLAIANPIHGEEFFSLLYHKDWTDKTMVGITRDKLYCLCTAKISLERRKELLHFMILTKLKDVNSTHFSDYKKMRFYMKCEAYWHAMFEEVSILIAKLEVEGPQLPKTFEVFYKASRRVHVALAYSQILGTMKSASDSVTLPEILESSKRLLYRWLLECMSLKTIIEMPIEIEEWKDMADENTMFSPSLVEKSITQWECSKCPWWLEYPLGVVPKCEQQLHALFLAENPIIEKHASTTIVVDGENTNVQQSKSASKKGKKSKNDNNPPSMSQSLHVEDEEEDSVEVPLICKRSKMGGTSKARSTMSESIIHRSVSERMPTKRVTSEHHGTFVDALLVDVGEIDHVAWHSINAWFKGIRGSSLEHGCSLHGASSKVVARLIFADFPTSMPVDGINEATIDAIGPQIPLWNHFNDSLVKGVMEICSKHLADEGFLVTLSLAEHLGAINKHVGRFGLKFHRSWTLDCDGGYVHPDTTEQVTDLTIGLFHRKLSGQAPHYNRTAGEEVSPDDFPARKSCITEGLPRMNKAFTRVDGELVRGGAERSSMFFSWLLATFTFEEDRVIDIFAGCGGLGSVCSEEFRHCLMLECDFFVFSSCLEKKICGPLPVEDD